MPRDGVSCQEAKMVVESKPKWQAAPPLLEHPAEGTIKAAEVGASSTVPEAATKAAEIWLRVRVDGLTFPYKLSEEDVWNVFMRYGAVDKVNVDHDGKFAEVFYENPHSDCVRAVRELDRRQLPYEGVSLRVEMWHPRRDPTSEQVDMPIHRKQLLLINIEELLKLPELPEPQAPSKPSSNDYSEFLGQIHENTLASQEFLEHQEEPRGPRSTSGGDSELPGQTHESAPASQDDSTCALSQTKIDVQATALSKTMIDVSSRSGDSEVDMADPPNQCSDQTIPSVASVGGPKSPNCTASSGEVPGWMLRSGAVRDLNIDLDARLAVDTDEDEERFDDVGLGVDLGAATLHASYWSGSEVTMCPTLSMPSFVGFTCNGKVLLGNEAKSAAVQNPGNIFSVKTLLERLEDLLGPASLDAPHQLVLYQTPAHVEVTNLRGASCKFLVAELLGFLLWRMRELAQELLEHTLEALVLGVPSWCTLLQRRVFEEAAQLAGFRRVRLLRTPVGAAVWWKYNSSLSTIQQSAMPGTCSSSSTDTEPAALAPESNEKQILLVDIGAASFQCALVVVENNVFQVRWSGGLLCGGLYVDDLLAKHCLEKMPYQVTVETVMMNEDGLNTKTFARLRLACEKAKRTLSTSRTAKILVPPLLTEVAEDVEVAISQKELAEIIKSNVLPKYKDYLERLVKSNESQRNTMPDLAKIHEVLFLGGGSKIPCLQAFLRDLICDGLGLEVVRENVKFGCVLGKGVPMIHANACGASLQGAILGAGKKEQSPLQHVMLIDACSYAIGVATWYQPAPLERAPFLNKSPGPPRPHFEVVISAYASFPAAKGLTIQLEGHRTNRALVPIYEEVYRHPGLGQGKYFSARHGKYCLVGVLSLPPQKTNADTDGEDCFHIHLDIDAAGHVRANLSDFDANAEECDQPRDLRDLLLGRTNVLNRKELARLSTLFRNHADVRWLHYAEDGLGPRSPLLPEKSCPWVMANPVDIGTDEYDDRCSEETEILGPALSADAKNVRDTRGKVAVEKLQKKLRKRWSKQPELWTPISKFHEFRQNYHAASAGTELSTTEVCAICLCSPAELGKEFTFVFEKCGHKCICKACLRKMKAKKKRAELECPLCRQCSKTVLKNRYEGDIFSAEA